MPDLSVNYLGLGLKTAGCFLLHFQKLETVFVWKMPG